MTISSGYGSSYGSGSVVIQTMSSGGSGTSGGVVIQTINAGVSGISGSLVFLKWMFQALLLWSCCCEDRVEPTTTSLV